MKLNRAPSYARILLLNLILAAPLMADDKHEVFQLWPGGRAPGDDVAAIGPERELPFLPYRGGKYEIAGQPVRWLTAVTEPTLALYRPAADKNNGAAVIICPGGGYWNLAIDLEGEEVAAWLNSLGITGIILKYRVPRRPGQDEKQPSPVALDDAQRAVSVVRSHAKEWGIDPNRIGMIGFSVGGGTVAITATNFDKRRYKEVDAIDKVSCRPDFGICCYSGYLKSRDSDELHPSLHPTKQTPPLFLVHANDDSEATADISIVGYLALKRAGAPVELHIYQKGEHGFGVRDLKLPVSNWTKVCADWMKFNGFLSPDTKQSAAASSAR